MRSNLVVIIFAYSEAVLNTFYVVPGAETVTRVRVGGRGRERVSSIWVETRENQVRGAAQR